MLLSQRAYSCMSLGGGEMNFNTIDLDKVKVKRVIICCNGFINLKKHALQSFSDYFYSLPHDENNEIALINLYNPDDKKTYSRKKQYSVLLKEVKKYVDKQYIIYLLGYSYTCGFCAKVASVYPEHIKKLVFIAPTLYLLKTKLLFSYLKMAGKYLKIRLKHPKKSKKTVERAHIKGIIPIAYNVARSIVKNRKYFKRARCKVFIGKAKDDAFCIGKTLWKITHRLEQNQVTIKSYQQGGHTMIMHLELGKDCYDDILSFTYHMKNPSDMNEENEEKMATLSFETQELAKRMNK